MLNEKMVIENLLKQKRTSVASVIVMMCGVAGSSKTTCAQKLEKEGFVRLSIDEDIWATLTAVLEWIIQRKIMIPI